MNENKKHNRRPARDCPGYRRQRSYSGMISWRLFLYVFVVSGSLVFADPVSAQGFSYGNPLDGMACNTNSPGGTTEYGQDRGHYNHGGTDFGCLSGGQSLSVPDGCSPTYNGGCSEGSHSCGGGFGNHLILDCGEGVQLIYAHLASSSSASNPICGNTGNSYGAHLHLEVHIDGNKVSPEDAMCKDLHDESVQECLLEGGHDCGEDQNPEEEEGEEEEEEEENEEQEPPPEPPGKKLVVPPKTSNNARNPSGRVTDRMSTDRFDQACDANVYQVIQQRAHFKVQENYVVSELLVKKPDSVMEYTCADQYAGIANQMGGRIFSNSTTWAPRAVMSSTGIPMLMNVSMDTRSLQMSLENTVTAAMKEYVRGNFPMGFLAGTGGGDYSPSGSLPGGFYTCSNMMQVWQTAKCTNFGEAKDFGSAGPFVTFQELAMGNDPRTHGKACNNTGLIPTDLNQLRNELFMYNGLEPAFFNQAAQAGGYQAFIQAEFGNIFQQATGAGQGVFVPYMHEYHQPGRCELMPPIPTGILVAKVENAGQATSRVKTYDEYFCPTPGCYYVAPSGTGFEPRGVCAPTN
jgi:murein DD-endopeptidase MepM/ murein hydrolase activator NlpD